MRGTRGVIPARWFEAQAFDVLPGLQLARTFLFMGRPSSAAEENGVTRILVVDDNPAVRRYLRTVLEPVSYTHLDVYKRQIGWSFRAVWQSVGCRRTAAHRAKKRNHIVLILI